MRTLFTAPVILATCFLTGCSGQGKEEAEREAKANEERRQLDDQSKSRKIKNQAAIIDSLESDIKGMQVKLVAVTKEYEKEHREKLNTLETVQRFEGENKKLAQRLEKADQDQQQVLAKFKEEMEKAMNSLRTELEKQFTAVKEEKKKLEQQILSLNKDKEDLRDEKKKLQEKVEELSPNTGVEQNTKRYQNESKALVVGFVPGKKADAEKLCQALGFEFIGIQGPKKDQMIFRWAKPITKEILMILGSAKSTIRYVQPDNPAGGQGAMSESARPARQEKQEVIGLPGEKIIVDPAGVREPMFLDQRWPLQHINVYEGWKRVALSKRYNPVIVAVIDTGVDVDHPWIKPHLWKNPRSRNLTLEDDEAGPPEFGRYGGYWNAFERTKKGNVTPGPMTRKPSNVEIVHGTHCAGIVASAACPFSWGDVSNVQIMPLKIGRLSDMQNAVAYAVKNGAKVLSISIAGRATLVKGGLGGLEQEIADATQKGVLVVCSVPNNKNNLGITSNLDEISNLAVPSGLGRKYWDQEARDKQNYPNPIAFRVDRMISVLSVTKGDRLSSFSCYGFVSADLGAPGGQGNVPISGDLSVHDPDHEIMSAIPTQSNLYVDRYEPTGRDKWIRPHKDSVAALYGTSQAAPHVAGAAALIWSHPRYNHLKAENIKKLLLNNVRPAKELIGKCSSAGVLDLSFLAKEFTWNKPPLARDHLHDGHHHFWNGQYRKSVASFEKATVLFHDPPSYYFSAFARASYGDRAGATRDLKIAMSLERASAHSRSSPSFERIQGPNRDKINFLRGLIDRGVPPRVIETAWDGWLDPASEWKRYVPFTCCDQ